MICILRNRCVFADQHTAVTPTTIADERAATDRRLREVRRHDTSLIRWRPCA